MFRGNGERWTGAQDRQLLDLKKQGKSAAFIATAIGRTRSAVTTRLSVLKSSLDQFRVTQQRAHWTREEDDRLRRLKEDGASWEELADELSRPVGESSTGGLCLVAITRATIDGAAAPLVRAEWPFLFRFLYDKIELLRLWLAAGAQLGPAMMA